MEGGKVGVAFLEGEGAEGKTESDVVDGVWFWGGGCLSVWDGNFDLLGHDVDVTTMVDALICLCCSKIS